MKKPTRYGVLLLLALSLLLPGAAGAQDQGPQLPPRAAPTTRVETGALPVIDATPAFDAARATSEYLARVIGAARARSDAYFEGGYWLQLVDLLWGLGIACLLLFTGLSTRLRDWAETRTRSRSAQVMLYGAVYITAVTVLELPLAIYEGFVREHAYGLSNQGFPAWAGDFGIGFALTLVAGVIVLPIFYAAIRAARQAWWLWGAGLAVLLLILQLAIYPVFIAPLFNHFDKMPDSPLQRQITAMARANQVPADAIWVSDASRQSNRISANVSGFLGTTRITLNDNLLKQGTPDEVMAVMGHELGHYVMGHNTRIVLLLGLVILAAFGFVAWSFGAATDFFGGTWQVRRVESVPEGWQADVHLQFPWLAAIYGGFPAGIAGRKGHDPIRVRLRRRRDRQGRYRYDVCQRQKSCQRPHRADPVLRLLSRRRCRCRGRRGHPRHGGLQGAVQIYRQNRRGDDRVEGNEEGRQ